MLFSVSAQQRAAAAKNNLAHLKKKSMASSSSIAKNGIKAAAHAHAGAAACARLIYHWHVGDVLYRAASRAFCRTAHVSAKQHSAAAAEMTC